MTTYSTGNPLGSKDPRDLYDNAENIDSYANGTDPMFPDRFGVLRLSIEGQQQAFLAAQEGRDAQFQYTLLNTGFVDIGNYGAGLIISERNQVFARDGAFYSASASLVLPYTLTGQWDVEGPNFILRGDAPLRADLAAASGANRVGFGATNVGDALTAQGDRVASLEARRTTTSADATATRTLTLADAYKLLWLSNVSAKTFTLPAQSAVAWPGEAEVSFFNDTATTLDISPAAGVTLKTAYGGSLTVPPGGYAWLKRLSENTWIIVTKALTAAPKQSYAGAKAFGDSITVGTGASRPSLAYLPQESEIVRTPFTNYALSGACVWDQATAVFGQTIAVNEAAQVMIGTNDSRTYGTAVANDLDVFKRGHAALVAWIATPEAYKTRADNSAVTYTGVWSNGTAYGGNWTRVSTANGATVTFTFFGPVVYLSTTRLGTSTAKGDVRIDGVLVGTMTSAGLSANTPLGAYFGPALYRFAGLANTSHTMVITVRDADASNAFFFEWFTAPSNINRFVNLINIPRITGGATADAKTQAYNTAILSNFNDMRSDGLKLALADAFAVIDPATDLADGLHPNDAGHAKIAAVASAAFQS